MDRFFMERKSELTFLSPKNLTKALLANTWEPSNEDLLRVAIDMTADRTDPDTMIGTDTSEEDTVIETDMEEEHTAIVTDTNRIETIATTETEAQREIDITTEGNLDMMIEIEIDIESLTNITGECLCDLLWNVEEISKSVSRRIVKPMRSMKQDP